MLKNRIICIFGKKGSGKTTFVLKEIIPQYNRVVILDSMSEYPFFPVTTIEDFLETLQANLNRNYFRIVYRPIDGKEAYFFKAVQKITNITIIVEEADLYSSAVSADEYLIKLVRYGRHFNQNSIFISRRPAEVSRTITAQADIIYTFQQTEKRDLEYFKFYMPNPEILVNLKNYVYPEKHTENIHYIRVTDATDPNFSLDKMAEKQYINNSHIVREKDENQSITD